MNDGPREGQTDQHGDDAGNDKRPAPAEVARPGDVHHAVLPVDDRQDLRRERREPAVLADRVQFVAPSGETITRKSSL